MTAELPTNLPEQIRDLQRLVERDASRKVVWVNKPDLGGTMGASWGEDGETPTVHYRAYSHTGAAEELWHLRLDQMGWPCARRIGRSTAVEGANVLLNNLLQHQLIYPRLAEMGLAKDDGECRAAGRHIVHWLERVAAGGIADMPHQVLAYVTMIYICSRAYCAPSALANLDALMAGIPEFGAAKAKGDLLLPLLDEMNENTTEAEYRSVLNQFVSGIGLTDDDVAVFG